MKYSPLVLACAVVVASCSSSNVDSTPTDGGQPTTDDGSGAGTDTAGSQTGDQGTTPDPGANLLIDADNFESILRDAVSAASATAMEADLHEVRRLLADLTPFPPDEPVDAENLSSRGLTFASEETVAAGTRRRYTCDAGGSIVLSLYDDDPLRSSFESDACYVGTDLYDGGYDRAGGLRGGKAIYDALAVTYPDGSGFSIDGAFERYDGRIGSERTRSWGDTEYVSRDTAGELIRITDLDQLRERAVTQPGTGPDLGDTAGYVSLDDGSVALAVPNNDTESLAAEFSFVSPATAGQSVDVEAELMLMDSYYTWYNQNLEERAGFVVPDFPVIDLGSPLTLKKLESGDTVSVEQSARLGENAEWDSGSLSVTAPDGSRIVMGPAADEPSMVEIRVNDADEPVLRERSEGFQVSCPGKFEECG